MKFTFIAVSVPALQQVLAFEQKYKKECQAYDIEITCFYVAGMEQRYLADPQILIDAVAGADIAVVDTMGASEALQEIVRQGLEQCAGQRIVIGNTLREYLRLGAFSMASMGKMMKKSEKQGEKGAESEKKTETKSALDKMHRMRRMALMLGNVLPFGITKDMKHVFLLIDYWQQATQTDMESFFALLLRHYCGQKWLPKERPCTMRYGIYLKDPESLICMDTVAEYRKKSGFDEKKDTIALLFYGHSYPNDFLPVVRAIAKKLRMQYNILPVAFSQNEDQDLEKLEQILCQQEMPVSAVVNLMPFRLGAGPMGGNAERAVEILKKLDVPYLKPFCLTKVSAEEWEAADAVNPGEFLISILLPELDGGIMSIPVGVMQTEETTVNGLELPTLRPLPERIDALSHRLSALLALKKKDKKEKKLAVIFYNYPPGESNVFGGAFLDTFASASELLHQLKKEGYLVDEMSPGELQDAFVSGGRCNEPEWSEQAETEFTYTIDGVDYPIRGIQNGNVFFGLQPVHNPEAYHDRNRAPGAEYQAFYRWIREVFGADAMIHFGTHGTLEFLPGKENGMMGDCWPDRLVGDLPHFYYYYVGNPSEAMIAKRRSLATLVSYQAPPLKKSGLYGEYQELKETIAEYRESRQSAPERCGDLLEQIGRLAENCHLSFHKLEKGSETQEEKGFDSGEAQLQGNLNLTESDLDEIEACLYEYENSLITDGLHTINEEEVQGLFHALDGGYLSAGTAGDVVKNPDILPTGRNLVQFDPRLVPTRTAYERGARAAQLSLERYREQTGQYPETTAVILWGLETSRSQGETIGQILYYLGLRLKTDKASYDDRLEVIPMEELDRPRVDVVIHICGFFRDMYPNLIRNLNEMLQRLLQSGESEEQNFFLKHTRRMQEKLRLEYEKNKIKMTEKECLELASCRIFGPKEGEYGTRLTEVVRKGSWKEASELGSSFVEDLSFGYAANHQGIAADTLLKWQYQQVEVMSQVRNNVEYELTDLDHYYEFYGGLAKAIENEKGEKPVMLVADTTGEAVRVQDLTAALKRGIATRLLNPVWIEGMMRHEYHGVQQIAKRFENVMGFAASTDGVESSTFSDLTRCYAADETLRHRMQESNRWGYMKMMERLMEANNRGYYQATEEELEQIQEAYLEAEGEAEE